MSTSDRKPVQWGVLIGEQVKPLPKARNVTDAALYASNLNSARGSKAVVVYRDSEGEMWQRWIDQAPVPTQLALDITGLETRA